MIIVYNKLVRDKMPQIIMADGKIPVTRKIVDTKELADKLMAKLDEEIQEYKESNDHGELADIMEVLRALAVHVHKMTPSELDEMREAKESERGGFEAGLVLERVID